MRTVIGDMLDTYLAARYGVVKRKTWLRDSRVIAELRAAIDSVENAGSGITSLGDRGRTLPTRPWDGLLTDLDADLLIEATKLVLAAERPVHRGRTVDTEQDAEVALRQLGRWMEEWRDGGINALSVGMRLGRSLASHSWAPPPQVEKPLTRPPQLQLGAHQAGPQGIPKSDSDTECATTVDHEPDPE